MTPDGNLDDQVASIITSRGYEEVRQGEGSSDHQVFPEHDRSLAAIEDLSSRMPSRAGPRTIGGRHPRFFEVKRRR
jgi:hypothetical protein